MAPKKRKAPSPPPARADAPVFTLLSKLTLSPGDVLAMESGQHYVYTADLRGCRWGRTLDVIEEDDSVTFVTGQLMELPDVQVRLVRSPNSERQEEKEAVVDPMTVTRR